MADKTAREDVDGAQLAHDRLQWPGVVNISDELSGFMKPGSLLISWATASFWALSLLRGIDCVTDSFIDCVPDSFAY